MGDGERHPEGDAEYLTVRRVYYFDEPATVGILHDVNIVVLKCHEGDGFRGLMASAHRRATARGFVVHTVNRITPQSLLSRKTFTSVE